MKVNADTTNALFLSMFTSFQVQYSLLPTNEVQPPQREFFKHHIIFCECTFLASVHAPRPWMHCPRNTTPSSPVPLYPLLSVPCFRGLLSYHLFSQVFLSLSSSSISLPFGFCWFHSALYVQHQHTFSPNCIRVVEGAFISHATNGQFVEDKESFHLIFSFCKSSLFSGTWLY